MKVTNFGQNTALVSNAASTPAGGVTVEDSGGYYTADDLEDILAEIGAGISPGAFLTVIGGGKGTVQALGTLGATETIDLANGNYFWGTLDQNCTLTTTGWTNLKDAQISVELIQNGTGGWTPTFSGVTWIGGTPTWVTTAGTVTHVVLFSRDGGTTIYGAVVGGGSPFAAPAIVLGTAAATGAATTAIRSDATIVAFDATVPAALGTAATGAAAVAARRDHVHPMVTGADIDDLGHWEVLMAAGVTPPEPLETGDGLDWLYGFVP